MARKWEPSNSTDFDWFVSDWCAKCRKHGDFGGELPEGVEPGTPPCSIIGRMLELIEGPYPKELTVNNVGNPICTAFVDCNAEPLPERCSDTIDLFTPKE